MTRMAYDFTVAKQGDVFEEWNKTFEICPACGRIGFDDSDAMENAFVHVMSRDEEQVDGDIWNVSIFMVDDYCNKVTTDWVFTDIVKQLPNRIKHPKEL